MVSNVLGRAYRKTIAAMDSSNTSLSVRDLFSGEMETPHSVPALWMATRCSVSLRFITGYENEEDVSYFDESGQVAMVNEQRVQRGQQCHGLGVDWPEQRPLGQTGSLCSRVELTCGCRWTNGQGGADQRCS